MYKLSHSLSTTIGVLIEFFFADFLTVFGLSLQKTSFLAYSPGKSPKQIESPRRVSRSFSVLSDDSDDQRPFVYNIQWWVGLVTFASGQAFEGFALTFTSQANISAFSNLTLVWNAFFAKIYFKETFNTTLPKTGELFYKRILLWDAFNYGVLILGSIITVLFVPVSTDDVVHADELLLNFVRFPYLGNLSAMLSAFSVTISKLFLTLFTSKVSGLTLGIILLYILVGLSWLVSVFGSIYALNIALKVFEQRVVVPIFEIMGSIYSITSGLLFYQTYKLFTPVEFYVFLFGMFLMVLGIIQISLRRLQEKEQLVKDETEIEPTVKTSLL
eukprot:snap_masked-scaffold_7-processed-gene-1.40-mRNA-1 protein AED:0.29 eAED:1.00 QI:0/0/0/1/1/1/2/0/328